MADIYVIGQASQGTSAPTIPPKLYAGDAIMSTSQACIVDLTPPTFAGISSLITGSLGQVRAGWAAATDPSAPIRYEIYIRHTTPAGLFTSPNLLASTGQLQYDIFTLPNGDLLQSGLTYYVGVRAVDGVGNRDTNVVTMTITTVGISAGGTEYGINGVFSVNESNQLIASFWADEDDELITAGSRLGTASYVIYDKNGNLVSGMSESGIVADANGLFEITPVASTLVNDLSYYTVKVTIVVDGVPRSNYLPIAGEAPVYEVRGGFSINASNQIQASFWVVKNGEQLFSNLGTLAYTIYDKDSVTTGITQSGISADGQGIFKSTPVSAVSLIDLTHYVAKIQVTANGKTHHGTIFLGMLE